MGARASSDGLRPPECGALIWGRAEEVKGIIRSFDELLPKKCSRDVGMALAVCGVLAWCEWLGDQAPVFEIVACMLPPLGAGGEATTTAAFKDGTGHTRDEEPVDGVSFVRPIGDACRVACAGNSITEASATSLHCSIGCWLVQSVCVVGDTGATMTTTSSPGFSCSLGVAGPLLPMDCLTACISCITFADLRRCGRPGEYTVIISPEHSSGF